MTSQDSASNISEEEISTSEKWAQVISTALTCDLSSAGVFVYRGDCFSKFRITGSESIASKITRAIYSIGWFTILTLDVALR